jgi:biotin carboxyl carrier protein
MRYYVTLEGRTVEVDLTGDRPVVDGVPIDARIATLPGTTTRHLLLGAVSLALAARPGPGRGQWEMTSGGKTVRAEVLDERARRIREMSGGAATEADRSIRAPMPGLVVRIQVEPGQSVSAGQGVVVVEAMKMENELKAPADGIVASIEVRAGQPVEKGAVLIVLE